MRPRAAEPELGRSVRTVPTLLSGCERSLGASVSQRLGARACYFTVPARQSETAGDFCTPLRLAAAGLGMGAHCPDRAVRLGRGPTVRSARCRES